MGGELAEVGSSSRLERGHANGRDHVASVVGKVKVVYLLTRCEHQSVSAAGMRDEEWVWCV